MKKEAEILLHVNVTDSTEPSSFMRHKYLGIILAKEANSRFWCVIRYFGESTIMLRESSQGEF